MWGFTLTRWERYLLTATVGGLWRIRADQGKVNEKKQPPWFPIWASLLPYAQTWTRKASLRHLAGLRSQFPLQDPTSVTRPSAPFCLFWEYSSCHFFFFFFNSLRHMLGVITFRHICLTSMLLSSGPNEQVGSIQIPNSEAFQSLPFIWIFYHIILLLSMAQVMCASKHVHKQLLHIKYSGFP